MVQIPMEHCDALPVQYTNENQDCSPLEVHRPLVKPKDKRSSIIMDNNLSRMRTAGNRDMERIGCMSLGQMSHRT